MQNLKNHTEKRAEPRFALQIPARIQPDLLETGSILDAIIEDISLHGLKFKTESYLQPGQEVSIGFAQPLSGQETVLQGRIRWVSNGNGQHTLGIQLLGKNNCILSLEQASQYLKPFTSSPPQIETRPKPPFLPGNFHLELFWGLLFKTFREILQSNLAHLCNSIDLSSVHLENFLQEYQGELGAPEHSARLARSLKKLNKSGQDLLSLVKLFRVMQTESLQLAQEREQDLPNLIKMHTSFQDRLQAFVEKLKYLNLPWEDAISLRAQKIPLFCGSSWRVAQGLDLLLLHAFQNILWGHASRINVELFEQQGRIVIEYTHTGSKLLQSTKEKINLSPLQWQEDSQQTFKDRRQLLWLHYVLYFFQDLDPEILILNQSGNNVVSLRLTPHC